MSSINNWLRHSPTNLETRWFGVRTSSADQSALHSQEEWFWFLCIGPSIIIKKTWKKMQVETYLVVQGYIVTHTYRGDISYTYGRLNPRNVHTYTKKNKKQKKKQKKKNTRIINSPPNPLHPSISMQILHTVLYTFPVVLTRRICLTIKGFLSGWSFHVFSRYSYMI